MARRTATIIIEPHLLVREALESLIKARYRVVCGIRSTADIDSSTIVGDGPKLVILSTNSTDDAIAQAGRIRQWWPGSKIVLLFEHASLADFHKLLTSELDGCVPLFASPDTLLRTLDLVTIENARVVVTANARSSAARPSPNDKVRQPSAETDTAAPDRTEGKSINVVSMPTPRITSCIAPKANGYEGQAFCAASPPNGPRLSEREAVILNGLVQGHSNKTIARTCDITEATVKVHMKAILRKVQVANRTQAAVWALEHVHSAQQIKDAC